MILRCSAGCPLGYSNGSGQGAPSPSTSLQGFGYDCREISKANMEGKQLYEDYAFQSAMRFYVHYGNAASVLLRFLFSRSWWTATVNQDKNTDTHGSLLLRAHIKQSPSLEYSGTSVCELNLFYDFWKRWSHSWSCGKDGQRPVGHLKQSMETKTKFCQMLLFVSQTVLK